MNDALAWPDRLRAELKTVGEEFTALAHLDDVFWQVQAILAGVGDVKDGNVFQTWIVQRYSDSVAIRLRRLGDRRSDSISLWRFLEDMKAEEGRLTRSWYKEMWPPDLKH